MQKKSLITNLTTLIFVMLFAIVLLSIKYFPQHGVTRDTENNLSQPYIWWYADTENAFVIESADGSDSRLLAQGLIPENHRIFRDTDFSPSGEWMAWRSDERRYGGPPNYQGFLMRVDGTRMRELHNVDLIHWSPEQDHLLIVYRETQPLMTVAILDVNTGNFLSQIILDGAYGFGDSNSFFNMNHWSQDGEEAYYYTSLGQITLTLDGQSGLIARTDLPLNVHAATDEFVIRDRATQNETGEAIYGVVLQNTRTNAEIVLDEKGESEPTYAIYPDSTGTNIFVELDEGDTVLVNLNNRSMVEMPEHASPSHCKTRIECNIYASTPLWSENENFALLEGLSSWYLVDIQSGDTTEILEQSNEFALQEWHWVNNDSELLLISQTLPAIKRYTFETGDLADIKIPYTRSYLYGLFSSPDGRYIGIFDGGIYDTLLNQELLIVEHSTSQRGAGLSGMDWHSDSNWFFTIDDTMYAGGGGAPTGRTIRNTDAFARELGDCWGDCSGFLPAHVIPHLPQGTAESVIQQPEAHLFHEGQVYGVTWNPDGTQLASYEYDENYIDFINLWDLSTEQASRIKRVQIDFDCRPHPLGCRLMWTRNHEILINNYEQIATFALETEQIMSIEPVPDPQYLHSPDGHYEALNLRGEPVQVIDTETGNLVFETGISWDEMAWGSDSRTVLISGYHEGEGHTEFWNGNDLRSLEYADNIYSISYEPATDLLAGTSFFNRIQIWNTRTGNRLTPLNWNARSLELSPDGMTLAGAGTQYVTLWDMSVYHD